MTASVASVAAALGVPGAAILNFTVASSSGLYVSSIVVVVVVAGVVVIVVAVVDDDDDDDDGAALALAAPLVLRGQMSLSLYLLLPKVACLR